MKIVYSDPKTGRTAQKEIGQELAVMLLNKRIGEIVDGSALGFTGYKLKITGGSDSSGFPMIKALHGAVKRRILKEAEESGKNKGMQKRMMVRGNVVSADTAQLNMVITEYGEKGVDELFPKKEQKSEEQKQ